jgi:hypothetical protein
LLFAIAHTCVVASVKLGPRIIPFFRTIISQSITVLRGNETGIAENFAVCIPYSPTVHQAYLPTLLRSWMDYYPLFPLSGEVVK